MNKAEKHIRDCEDINYIPSQKQGSILITEGSLVKLLKSYGKKEYKRGYTAGLASVIVYPM
jgi:hypothetical protein